MKDQNDATSFCSRDIKLQADIFFSVYEQINENNGDKFIPVAAIINGCFACELYLKALIRLTKPAYSFKSLKGHSLSNLFRELSKQNKIIANSIETTTPAPDFNKELTKISNNFVTWRYIYEIKEPRTSFSFLYFFSKRLKEEIEIQSQKPEFVSNYVEKAK